MTPWHPLDNPARAALAGPQAGLARRRGPVLSYPDDVSPFDALPDEPDEATWRDAAAALGPAGVLVLTAVDVAPPPGWAQLMQIAAVQMTGEAVAAAPDREAVPLTRADVPEMLDLVARTEPGPFLPGTIELGGYLGIRRGGQLIAMAGQRLRPPGWTEISAVCTDAPYRGRGLGSRLVRAVAVDIRARGETPFLHAAAGNPGAIRLYESLGFRRRRDTLFRAVQVPPG